MKILYKEEEHTSESSSSSADNSALSGDEDRKKMIADTRREGKEAEGDWLHGSLPRKGNLTSKGGGRKGNSREPQYTSSGHHSEQYLNRRDPPQSVRQTPDREHYQSE